MPESDMTEPDDRSMPHLLLDMFDVPEAHMDADYLRMALRDLATHIGMEIRLGPRAFRYEVEIAVSNEPGSPVHPGIGTSAFAIISTSHVSVHGVRLAGMPTGEVHADVFSCNAFDEAQVMAFFEERLHVQSREMFMISVRRAQHSPRMGVLALAQENIQVSLPSV